MMLFHWRHTKAQFKSKSIIGNWQKMFSIISSGRWENSVPEGLVSESSSVLLSSSSSTGPFLEELADRQVLVFLAFFFLHFRESWDFEHEDELARFLPVLCEDSILSLAQEVDDVADEVKIAFFLPVFRKDCFLFAFILDSGFKDEDGYLSLIHIWRCRRS